jgi:nuclear pore complex protein Nup155
VSLNLSYTSNSTDLSSFVDQPDVITHVALVKPKPGVFIDEITNLLVICTPVSVILIGLSSATTSAPNGRQRKEIKLFATDMSTPTDVTMDSVIGTKDGRVFMCGSQDGNLYELHYQEKEGWFGKKVQLVNHSIGGVGSLFPRFASATSDGQEFKPIFALSELTPCQIESLLLYQIPHEIVSIP